MLLELEHLASRLIYTSWKKIKPSHPYGGENPVVERSLAKVLCLLCFATNDEDFIFCKKCGSHKEKTYLDQDPNTNKSPHTKRLLNTTATIDTQETAITTENNKFQQFRAARLTNIRSKNVLKSFEIFVHSRGLCKYYILITKTTATFHNIRHRRQGRCGLLNVQKCVIRKNLGTCQKLPVPRPKTKIPSMPKTNMHFKSCS